jgi:phosphate-selective porin OprO/OprP
MRGCRPHREAPVEWQILPVATAPADRADEKCMNKWSCNMIDLITKRTLASANQGGQVNHRTGQPRRITFNGWFSRVVCCGAVLVLAGNVPTAHAQELLSRRSALSPETPSPDEVAKESDFDDLRKRIERLENENRKLRGSVNANEVSYSQPPQAVDNSFLAAIADRVSSLEVRTADKMPLIKLGGFFQVDNVFYGQNQASQTTYGDMEDGTGFRRARLQAYGSVTPHTNYIIEMDFATAGRPSFMDVWGEQTNLGWLGTVRVGQFRQPTTMDALTSIRHMEFMERSNVFQALDPFRRVGIMSYNATENQRVTWAGSVYRTGFTNPNNVGVDTYGTLGDTRYGTFIGDNGGWSTAYRATSLLLLDESCGNLDLLHVGAGYNYSRIGGNGGPASGTNGGQYIARTIPGVFVGDPTNPGITSSGTPFLSNTGNIAASQFDFWHLELAGQYGSAHFQTEYMVTDLSTDTFGHQMLNGCYAQCGYFLTGEHAGYNKVVGVMDYNVKPLHKFGAWEVAYRFDYTNLPNIGQVPAVPVAPATVANAGTGGANPNPGQLYMNTIALNWWLNSNARVQFEYINATNNSNFASYGSSNTQIFASRFQVEF